MSESHGIPTTYAGINFRSRLESRYALLLDALDLVWHYEPLELQNYIPDLLVDVQFARDYRAGNLKTIFEVRPESDVTAAVDKISRSGWDGAACVVTATPWTNAQGYCLGFATDRVSPLDAGRGGWQAANWHPFGYDRAAKRLVWGGGDDLTAEWRDAGNRSQWQAPVGRK
jgi:hypothetical protein